MQVIRIGTKKMDESSNLILEKIKNIEEQIRELSLDIRHLKDNHLHHFDLRLTKLETSLSIGWKAVIFGAGIPAIVSSILSIFLLLK